MAMARLSGRFIILGIADEFLLIRGPLVGKQVPHGRSWPCWWGLGAACRAKPGLSQGYSTGCVSVQPSHACTG